MEPCVALFAVCVCTFFSQALRGCVATAVVKARLGRDIMLPCPHTLSLEDVALVQWSKMDEGSLKLLVESFKQKIAVFESLHYNISANYSLAIRSVSFMDAGRYRCYVSNFDTTPDSSTYEVILQVNGASNETIKGHVGESVTFACPSSSEPRAPTYWKKYSLSLSQDSPNATFQHGTSTPGYTVGSNGFLTIKKISTYDEGVYECYQPRTGTAGYVLHIVYFHAYALPKTSPLIDGCAKDGKECERVVSVGIEVFFTCIVENVYPERYPTWGEQSESKSRSINSDGTFNTTSSITVNGEDTPAERVCSFVMEGFNASSHLVVKAHRVPTGLLATVMVFIGVFGSTILVHGVFCAANHYAKEKRCWSKQSKPSITTYQPSHQEDDQGSPTVSARFNVDQA